MKKEDIITICRLLLTLLWVYVAVSKLLNYDTFKFALNRQPLPLWSVPVLAIALPLVELGAAILLSLEKSRTLGFLISLILMIAFTLYVGLALSGAFGRIPCSCGGIISKLKWKGHFVFNICYTIIAWVGWHLQSNNTKVHKQGTKINNQLVSSADM